eukprot:gene8970-919_t
MSIEKLIRASDSRCFICDVKKDQILFIEGEIEKGCCGTCLIDFYIPSFDLNGYSCGLIQLFMNYPSYRPMRLLGEIVHSDSSVSFFDIGKDGLKDLKVKENGKLYVFINDSTMCYWNNFGNVKVKIVSK